MYQAFQEGRVQDAMKAQINANRVISVLMSFRGAGRHQGHARMARTTGEASTFAKQSPHGRGRVKAETDNRGSGLRGCVTHHAPDHSHAHCNTTRVPTASCCGSQYETES